MILSVVINKHMADSNQSVNLQSQKNTNNQKKIVLKINIWRMNNGRERNHFDLCVYKKEKEKKEEICLAVLGYGVRTSKTYKTKHHSRKVNFFNLFA